MKRIFTFLLAINIMAITAAQSPEKMSYQALIHDAENNLLTNQSVGMQISILQGDVFGESVYVETQTATTDANGLLDMEIGSDDATVTKGAFGSIDWSNGPHFIKIETDPSGGTNYTITGTSQLLGVPYALHAKTAENITENDPRVPAGTQVGEMQYWNGMEWITITPGTEGQVLTFVSGIPTWKSYRLVGENDVRNPLTGDIWMDKNLGASQVATSSADENAYGDLYQWGRAADGHELRTSGTTATLSNSDTPGHGDFITASNVPFDWRSPQNDNLWQGVDGTNNPCPIGYRLPTDAEWEAERQSWSSNNAAGAFGSQLKLPVGGARFDSDGSQLNVDSHGYYWSSTVDGTDSGILDFSSSDAGINVSRRAFGLSVRCIKD